jgi:undecaprenyl diphosphate synthase
MEDKTYVYIVYECEGSYEDYWEHAVKGFYSEEKAKQFAKELDDKHEELTKYPLEDYDHVEFMQELDMNRIPEHIGIILDGNGRWAKKRHMPRMYGHRHGAFTLRDIARYANSIGVKYMTVYCFSTENWKRPEDEVGYLMKAPSQFFKRFFKDLVVNTNIRYQVIGRKDRIPPVLSNTLKEAVELTKNHTGMVLTLCIDYGSQDEITTAVKEIAKECKDGAIQINDITPEMITNHLFTKDYPKLDLLIRTSGECRLSNFLLWQAAYSELYFTDTLFPDFTPEELKKALIAYQGRDRRFGGLSK